PDVYEERRDVLDLSFRTTLPGGLGVKIDAKNLLDAPYELTQGDVLRESYRSGRSFAIGLTWQPCCAAVTVSVLPCTVGVSPECQCFVTGLRRGAHRTGTHQPSIAGVSTKALSPISQVKAR